jgi:hypothetical protein
LSPIRQFKAMCVRIPLRLFKLPLLAVPLQLNVG